MLIDEIKVLLDKFYQACGELHENREFVKEYRGKILEHLYELYEMDYKLIKLNMLEVEHRIKELEERREIMEPKTWRSWIFWKKSNTAQQLLTEEAQLHAQEFFDRKKKAIEELAEIIRQADEMTTAEVFDEVQEEESREPEEEIQEAEPEEPEAEGAQEQKQTEEGGPGEDTL